MCIIVAKPKNVPLPSTEILENCFRNNPDGAGIMYSHKGMVHGIKGFMDFDSFSAQLDLLSHSIGDLTPLNMVLHFRIGTSGKNDKGNTHPFPATDDYSFMRSLSWDAPLGIAHNGIMHTIAADPDVSKYHVSDTMVFVKKFLYPIAKHTSITQDKEAQYILHHAANSKLVFMDKNALITLGDFSSHDGCLYSNDTWKSIRYSYRSLPTDYHFPYSDGYYTSFDYPSESYMIEDAYDLGLLSVANGDLEEMPVWLDDGRILQLTEYHAVDPESGDVYLWNPRQFVFDYTGETLSVIPTCVEE